MFRSINNGNQWEQINNGLNSNTGIFTIATNAEGIIFISTEKSFGEGGIYRSTVNGDYWVQSGLTDRLVYALQIDFNDYITAATDSGVYRSIDNGDSWEWLGLDVRINTIAINSIGDVFASTSEIGRASCRERV